MVMTDFVLISPLPLEAGSFDYPVFHFWKINPLDTIVTIVIIDSFIFDIFVSFCFTLDFEGAAIPFHRNLLYVLSEFSK